jgi:hypothetical protein
LPCHVGPYLPPATQEAPPGTCWRAIRVERRRTASALMRRRVLSREWHADGLGEAAPIAQVAHGPLAGIHDGEEGQVVPPVLEM